MRWCTYFRLLLWKNVLTKLRHKTELVVEIILPVLFILILVAIRGAVTADYYDKPLLYPPQPIGRENLLMLRDVQNETIKWEISYAPRHLLLDELVIDAARQLDLESRGFHSSEDLELYMMQENAFVGVVFDVDTENLEHALPKKFSYRIRFPAELRLAKISDRISNWETEYLFPFRIDVHGPRNPADPSGGGPEYIKEGFIAVQNAISASFIKLAKEVAAELPKIELQRFPYPPYLFDIATEPFKQVSGIMIALAFMVPSIQFIKYMTVEKDLQLKEAMKIMGLPTTVYWCAWFVTMFVALIILLIIALVFLFVPWFKGFTVSVLNKSSWTLVFTLLLIYMVSSITFCFMVSSFFTRSIQGGPACALMWFMTCIPFAIICTYSINLPLAAEYAVSLFQNSAMPMAFSIILSWEGLNTGAHWHNLFEQPRGNETITLGEILIIMVLDGVLYLLLTLYVEKIMPGSYGTAYKWYFPVTKSFWTGKHKNTTEEPHPTISTAEDDRFEKDFGNNNHVGIRLINLQKNFGSKVAVAGLNMEMFENQITVLLGHNGAGKTTTISMITGLITPTAGTAIVNGLNMLTEFSEIRKNLGFCPQYNILFDELTVEEHIRFYGRLKGIPREQIAAEVDKYLKRLELDDKRHALSCTLSGGMKRKLSVGIALCGDSKFVLCDEPSAGMDPAARRALWQLLQNEKKGRTILLTTHLMDEADVLGDRVAIMSEGKLSCSGTPFFLKKRFGSGYKLICSKQPNCDSKVVTNLIRKFIPTVSVHREIGTELTYELPEIHSKVFAPMLRGLEDAQQSLGLYGYGVSMASLEEVFLKTGTEIDNVETKINDWKNSSSAAIHVDPFNANEVSLVSGAKHVLYQWKGMFFKKSISYFRSWYLLVIQLSVPIFFTILGYFLSDSSKLSSSLPPLEYTLNDYGRTVTFFHDCANSGVAQSYQDMFKSFPVKDSLKLMNNSVQETLLALGELTLDKFKKQYLVAATIEEDGIIGWFNNQALHTAPLTLNLIYNAIAAALLGPEYRITVINDPLPLTINYQLDKLKGTTSLGFQLSLNVTFAMAFVSSVFVMFLITERVSRSKLLQLISGVRLSVFWITHFICDFMVFVCVACVVTLVMYALQMEGFKTGPELEQIFLVLILYGFAALPISYAFSFYFDEPATGLARVALLHLFTGNALFILGYLISFVSIGNTLEDYAIIFPNFALAQAISEQAMFKTAHSVCSSIATQMNKPLTEMCAISRECCNLDPLGWNRPGIGKILASFSGVGCSLLLFLFFREMRSNRPSSRFCKRTPALPDETKGEYDDDVRSEKRKIANFVQSEIKQKPFMARDLTKFYDKFLAVNRLSVSVSRGECFGLLGVNGAGKTSAFKMMVGDETITHGNVWINGIDAQNNTREVYPFIGYCPQYDILLPHFSGMEMLRLFAMLRGIPVHLIDSLCRQLAADLAFERHLFKDVSEYSGGNRRKLSTAIALLGNPHVIYLDEPTAGIDPASRRKLWDVVCRFRDMGKAIILTSHSMEESEALCTRIGIMVNGEFKCVGSSQHLKNKYSPGRSLTIKLAEMSSSDSQSVINLSVTDGATFDLDEKGFHLYEFVTKNILGAKLKECHTNIYTYELPSNTMPYSQTFDLIESNKDVLGIEDYSLSQGTLEQVFLSFTNSQRETA